MRSALLSIVLIGSAVFIAAVGIAVLSGREAVIRRVGHLPETLPQVFAGRYFAMALMVLALTVLEEWRALAVVLGIGALMGLFDAVVVGRAGGGRLPHLVAAGVCVLLAAGALWIRA